MKVIVNVEVVVPDDIDTSTDDGYESMEYAAKEAAERALRENDDNWWVVEADW